MLEDGPRWWEIRHAANLSASVYRCPICEERLPALLDHVLLSPEGDRSRRRHAHADCVREARRRDLLPTFDEWKAASPKEPSLWRRALRRLRGS